MSYNIIKLKKFCKLNPKFIWKCKESKVTKTLWKTKIESSFCLISRLHKTEISRQLRTDIGMVSMEKNRVWQRTHTYTAN